MLIWVPFVAVILVCVGYFLSRQRTRGIPILVNGLIPSKRGAKSKEESGTTVLIFYADEDPRDEKAQIFRGYADEDGRVEAHISSDNVGCKVQIRVRHAAYKFEDFQMTVPRHGIVHTMKMVKDGEFNGEIRGKDVGDLAAYYDEALSAAEVDRAQYIQNAARILSHPFARIPVYFWLVVYFASILAFAGDYWRFGDSFHAKWESFAHTIYFSTVTITTLGYGETYPKTDLLRMAVSFEAILGIFVVGFALNSLFYGPRR